MYLLNNNPNGQMTQKVNWMLQQKIKHRIIQDYYVIKTANQLFSSTVYALQSTQVKPRYAAEKNSS